MDDWFVIGSGSSVTDTENTKVMEAVRILSFIGLRSDHVFMGTEIGITKYVSSLPMPLYLFHICLLSLKCWLSLLLIQD